MTERTDKRSADEDLDDLLGDYSQPKETKKTKAPTPVKPQPEEDEWEKPGQKVSGKELVETETFKPVEEPRRGYFSPPKSAQAARDEEEDPEELFAGMLKGGSKMVV